MKEQTRADINSLDWIFLCNLSHHFRTMHREYKSSKFSVVQNFDQSERQIQLECIEEGNE